MQVIPRFFNNSTKSFFLFGPRGTGKSTLMKMLYRDAVWIDLLRPDVLRSYLARPERLREVVLGSQQKTVVVDEIQRAPSLLTVVHEIIELKKGYQFILTGSSARKLKRTGSDLLGGRALKREMHPFIASELGSDFSLSDAINYGLLPLLLGDQKPKDTLNGYVNLYLEEEIQAEGLVRNIEAFSRFLEIISFSHASLLNIANIARECEVKRKTVENYIDILKELLLAFQLTIFSKRAKRALSSHPKFYLFDAGVFRTLRSQGPFDTSEEIEGMALEGLVAQHLIAWNDYSETKHSIHFWRTRAGVEVDFIIYGPNGLWAIEVKNSKKIYPQDTRGLETFLEDYPIATAILLYRGTERMLKNKILCLPCEDFLKQIQPNQNLWTSKEIVE